MNQSLRSRFVSTSPASTSSTEVAPLDSPFGISSGMMSFLLMTLGTSYCHTSGLLILTITHSHAHRKKGVVLLTLLHIGYWRVKHWKCPCRSSHADPSHLKMSIVIRYRRTSNKCSGLGWVEVMRGEWREKSSREMRRGSYNISNRY